MGDEIERDYLTGKLDRKLKNLTEEERNLSSSLKKILNNREMFDIKIKLKIIFIQNIGIILGFCFMLFMAIFSENIQL
jgi:hypothetical protein